ncbi:aminoglycoside phosphotransferase family protein [Pelagimonas sp. KU-00592-HH]|uniref:aminoglycoside phosphotransferase family protein n=1 Tax=Pelagimonas sp. KU-00592-HH TaxID=3127651 RepID=UPI003341FA2E
MAKIAPGAAVAEWEFLSGGRTNSAWRLHLQDGDLVVKLYSGVAENPLFPNAPDAEARLLQELEGSGLAPRLVAQIGTPAGACNIYGHIQGQVWSEDTAGPARLMKTLHMRAPLQGLRSVADGSEAVIEHTRTILSKCVWTDHIDMPPIEDPVAPSGRSCLLHCDIVPGNLIHNAGGLHLIDWQCPAVGDPCEDIAIFLSPAMQSLYRGKPLRDAEVAAFMEAYDCPEVTARYAALAPFYHWRMAAYCQWQAERGRTEYEEVQGLEIAAAYKSASANPR